MRKIFISTSSFGKLDSKPIELLKKARIEFVLNPYGRKLNQKEIIQFAYSANGLIAGTESLDKETLNRLNNLKVISRCGAGLDNIDLEAASQLGIKVFNTPDGPTWAVAELTIGLILALLRRIPIMDRQIRDNKWNKEMGNLLCGKHIGIVGFGRIGRKVAELLKAFEVEIFYCDPCVNEKILGANKVEFKTILSNCDIITLHIPLCKENINFFGDNEFSLMKPGAFLVNCSRGCIVNEKALYTALKEGKLSGAAIDVFEHEPYSGPLKEFNNVVLTPHIGSYAQEARINMEISAVNNLIKGLD